MAIASAPPTWAINTPMLYASGSVRALCRGDSSSSSSSSASSSSSSTPTSKVNVGRVVPRAWRSESLGWRSGESLHPTRCRPLHLHRPYGHLASSHYGAATPTGTVGEQLKFDGWDSGIDPEQAGRRTS
ncbi:hypothetical protein BHE74_00032660 [Ensete ventricosum]|nr:hypothetical protein BHE74_00032660 [Ensete ventricosum]